MESQPNRDRAESRVTPTAPPWVARVAREDAQAVAALLRRTPDVRASIVDNQIWLRGSALDERIESRLQHLAPIETFTLTSDDELIPHGNLLPVGRLPDHEWQPIDRLIAVEQPTAALTGTTESRAKIELVRDGPEQPATLLLTGHATWAAYAQTAPTIRLKRLRFAASAQHVLLRGQPLPPIKGRSFYQRSGVIVPCGFAWSPRVDAESVRRAMSLGNDELAIFFEDGTWQLLTEACFVQARRSAVRLTVSNLQGATT